MKHPRKRMSPQKLALIQKIEHPGGQHAPEQHEDDPLTNQAPPEAGAPDIKHTQPTQGSLHRRHK